MTKKQEELLNSYISRANAFHNYIAVDSDGSIFGYEKKPEWIADGGFWNADLPGTSLLLGCNKKLSKVAKESLRPIYPKRQNALTKFISNIARKFVKADATIQSGEKEVEDFDLDDFLMKEKLSRFSQKERLKQIEDFKPSLIIHNDEFKGTCDDLEEYQKEFSLIEDLFAIRFYYINKKRNAVGFQIFIEDDGNFYLWNSDNGGVHTDWIPKLYLLIKKANKMINDYSHGRIKPNKRNG